MAENVLEENGLHRVRTSTVRTFTHSPATSTGAQRSLTRTTSTSIAKTGVRHREHFGVDRIAGPCGFERNRFRKFQDVVHGPNVAPALDVGNSEKSKRHINTVSNGLLSKRGFDGRSTIFFMVTQPKIYKDLEEFGIFVERFVHFMNLWTVYHDLLSGRYKPSVNPPDDGQTNPSDDGRTDMRTTIMFLLYAFFFSLVEDDADSVNAFRVWRVRFPEEEAAIAAVEARVIPFKNDLRVFRNRLGFHGSRSRAHEAGGLDLFANHSGTDVLNAMRKFKSLGAALLAKENAQRGTPEDVARVRQWLDRIGQQAGQP